MTSRTISAENAADVLLSLVTECDSLELERIINAMSDALRFARNRSQRNTEIDQRLYANRHDELPTSFSDMTSETV